VGASVFSIFAGACPRLAVWAVKTPRVRRNGNNGKAHLLPSPNQIGLWKIAYFGIASSLFAWAAWKRFSLPHDALGKIRVSLALDYGDVFPKEL
jgi:hypothetical protein